MEREMEEELKKYTWRCKEGLSRTKKAQILEEVERKRERRREDIKIDNFIQKLNFDITVMYSCC